MSKTAPKQLEPSASASALCETNSLPIPKKLQKTRFREFPPTFILRHRKENLKKCSLRHLEARPDLRFFTHPLEKLPDLTGYLVLTLDGPVLEAKDGHSGLLLLDGTWRYAEQMSKVLPACLCARSLPSGFKTAYPRRQADCPDPTRGLASIEALYVAYWILGREPEGLLDHYYWKELFLKSNEALQPQTGFPLADKL